MPKTETSLTTSIQDWFAKKLPKKWFTAPPEISVDPEEILIVGSLPAPADEHGAAAADEQILKFREETRDERIAIAREAEALFLRKVSWGVACGEQRLLFTSLSIPVMTRLRLPERVVLDTLLAGGVARSRSEALGWCVRLVGRHEADWLADLREALVDVQRVRSNGPGST